MWDVQHDPSPKMRQMDGDMQNSVTLSLFLLQVQRYEAASTIYGPHTLSAYIQLFRALAKAIATVIKTHMHVCLRGGEMQGDAKENRSFKCPVSFKIFIFKKFVVMQYF